MLCECRGSLRTGAPSRVEEAGEEAQLPSGPVAEVLRDLRHAGGPAGMAEAKGRF